MRTMTRFAIVCILVTVLVPKVTAQTLQRLEVGSGTSYVNYDSPLEVCSSPKLSVGPELTWNVNRTLALDSKLRFLAGSSSCISPSKGGNSVQLFAGPRVSLRGVRSSFFVSAMPGMVRWNRTLANNVALTSPAEATFTPRKFPAVTFSAGFEYYASRRVKLRFSAGDTLIRTHVLGTAYYSNNPELSVVTSYGFGRDMAAVSREVGQSQQSHRFFDAKNVVLTGISWAGLASDAIETQRRFAPCKTQRCRSMGESDALTRPFVKYGWYGQGPLLGLAAGGDLLLRYQLHRMRQHRVERIVPFVVAFGSGWLAFTNARTSRVPGPFKP
jgi:hypothetical protein